MQKKPSNNNILERKTSMNILILQGSPRANGNTMWMAEECRKAPVAGGHKVTLVNVARKKIASCLACEYCHGKGSDPCIQKDDMQELYPLLAEAEVLVVASPIYYFTLSAQIQAAIQRFHAIWKPANVKKTAFLLSSHSRRMFMAVQLPNTRALSPSAATRTSASSQPKSTSRRPRRRAGRFSNSSEKFDTRPDEMCEMMLKPEIPDMCRNEVRDFVIELVQRELWNIPDGTQSRREEFSEVILSQNRESGERAKLREETGTPVKEWKVQAEQITGLERLGFTVTKGKKHYKMRWRDSGYFKTLSASPSDFRTGANGLAEMFSRFF